MKTICSLFFFTLFFLNSSQAQNKKIKEQTPQVYNWGVGLVYGPQVSKPESSQFKGVSIKKYFKSRDAVELQILQYPEGGRVTGLLELHPKLNGAGTIRAVIGPGFHMAIRKKKFFDNYSSNPVAGIDLMVGLEVKIPKTPIAFGFHANPWGDFIGNNEFVGNWVGGSIHFVF